MSENNDVEADVNEDPEVAEKLDKIVRIALRVATESGLNPILCLLIDSSGANSIRIRDDVKNGEEVLREVAQNIETYVPDYTDAEL